MQSNVTSESGQGQQPEQDEAQASSQGSGQGAAAALARLKSQREHHARHQPADEGTLAGRRGGHTPST